jgi:hypothetical protein
MGQWSPECFIQWAEKTGPATAKLISNVLCARRHPEQEPVRNFVFVSHTMSRKGGSRYGEETILGVQR